MVILETTQGTIEIKLMPDAAPKACDNFVKLAEKGYYNGLIFHRVIKGFMIQGGDPTGTGRGGSSVWGKPFEDEFNSNIQFDSPGIVAMANAGAGTNGSQFFITYQDNSQLSSNYTVWGHVTKGLDIVKAVAAAGNAADGVGPAQVIAIEKVKVK